MATRIQALQQRPHHHRSIGRCLVAVGDAQATAHVNVVNGNTCGFHRFHQIKQAQVLNIMKDLQRSRGLTYLFISHNLAVVRHVADRVGVMYLGRLVEIAEKKALFREPRHPYTRMLLDAIPDIHMSGRARTPVQGEVPNPLNPPTGCAFHPRCPHANARCASERPALTSFKGVEVACHAVAEGRI